MKRGLVPLLILLACVCAACRTSRAYHADPTVYDRLSEREQDALRTPRVLMDAGRHAEAHALLLPLAHSAPRNLRIGTFLQEVELALLADGESVRGVRLTPGEAPSAALFVPYLRRAQEVPTSEAWVLAARLASDPDQAGVLLEQALAIDGDNPWAHYGMAWLHASRQRYSEARKALERAFAIDPGHLPSIRLDGALQARAGEEGRAVQAFESWLERSVEDPTIDPRERATVRLDLAILLVLEEEPSQALTLLEAVEPSVPQREAQVELVRAAAYHELGALEEAQRAVRFAREASPEELFVSVDEALLAAQRGDPDGERAAWAQALAIAEREHSAPVDAEPADFRSVLVRLQALTRLARLGAEVP